MCNFKVAAAQISSTSGDVRRNIESHIKAIDVAVENQTSIIIFPELSLTGYEPELALSLAFSVGDERLRPLISAASENDIWIVVGAPLKSGNEVHIGSIIFSPDGSVLTYSKMNLHTGEEQFFTSGKESKIVEVHGHKVGIAICADTNNPLHSQIYAKDCASVYAAGVFITEDGYASDTKNLQSYATEHEILVIMANHNKTTGGWQPIGKSAAWSKDGLLSVASEEGEAVVICHPSNGTWESRVIEL